MIVTKTNQHGKKKRLQMSAQLLPRGRLTRSACFCLPVSGTISYEVGRTLWCAMGNDETDEPPVRDRKGSVKKKRKKKCTFCCYWPAPTGCFSLCLPPSATLSIKFNFSPRYCRCYLAHRRTRDPRLDGVEALEQARILCCSHTQEVPLVAL